MPRQPRSAREAEVHHAVNRGGRRRTIFSDDQDRLAFVGILSDALNEHNAKCVALCLMDNHFHLLIRADTLRLGKVMQLLGHRYTQRYNHKHGFDGALLKGRFFSKPVSDDDYLKACLRYIHRNPKDIRPPVALASYRWSSYRHYLGRSPKPAWLDLDYGLHPFQGSRAEFGRFVERNDQPLTPIKMLEKMLSRSVDAGTARHLATHVARRIGWRDSEIVDALNARTQANVRTLRSRAERLIRSDPVVCELVESCLQDLEIMPVVVLPQWLTKKGPTESVPH